MNRIKILNGDITKMAQNLTNAGYPSIEPGQNRRDSVYSFLDGLGIEYGKVDHPPIFTQADSELRPVQIGADIFKNLFLRNKDKSRYYLYSLPLTKRADLAAVAKTLGETRLSFGDEYALQEKLNIQHGAVSFLNVFGLERTDVTILIDSSAFFCDQVGVHPNDNTATVILKPHDIQRILDACGVEYRFIALDNGEPVLSRAQEKDAAEILRLQYAAYQSEAILYNNYTVQPLTQTLEQKVEEFQGAVILKAVLKDRIIGSVRAYANNGTAYIGKLIVLPGYQNRGIGKQLLQAIENEFQDKRFELYTGGKSEKNLALYEKCGYTRFKTEEIAPGLTLVSLEKLPGDSVNG
jgi:ribosomal protein S18 acetylase RimI-like enzyme